MNQFPQWHALKECYRQLQNCSVSDLSKINHTSDFKQSACGIELDFARQRLDLKTLNLLIDLANARELPQKIKGLFNGEKLNRSENRPALHTALRAEKNDAILVDKVNIVPEIIFTLSQMEAIADRVRHKLWFGASGEVITDIVNIGIGGSDLGPKMALDALQEFTDKRLAYHFISDLDPDSFNDVIDKLNPKTTLFIVASKSFTTKETLINFNKACLWLNDSNAIKEQVIAVTANIDKAYSMGVKQVLPIWDFIGGRFSFFSAVNLILMIAVGPTKFYEMIAGGRSMDEHFKSAPFAQNLPVLLALIGIWNINFFNANNHVLLAYSKRLQFFIPYLQQLDMESNGKHIDIHGNPVAYPTGPIVWGGLGNQAQHAYYQLLCQGSHKTAVDFILIDKTRYQKVNRLALDKMDVLSFGYQSKLAAHHNIKGNVPLNKLTLTRLTPATMGALIALYEHKIFCQSILWNINAFDQPGVESAKKLATEALMV
jgi:glucose-6-phosphate isomerase